MKTRYLVINKDNQFIGTDLNTYNKLELACLWGFTNKKELKNMFKGFKIIKHADYVSKYNLYNGKGVK